MGLTCNFSAVNSADPNVGDAITYLWDFGDSSVPPVTTASATKTYAAAGTYTVKVTVTDGWGAATVSSERVVTVAASTNTAPTAAFTYSCSVRTNVCTFNGGTSTDDGGAQALNYTWAFSGAGSTTGSGSTVVRTFSAAGNFTATLTVRDAFSATGAVTQTVTIGVPPDNTAPIAVIATQNCLALVCNFSAGTPPTGSRDANVGDTITYLWNFGDGTTSTAAQPSKTYLAPGPYTVTLTVTDGWLVPSVPVTTTVTVA